MPSRDGSQGTARLARPVGTTAARDTREENLARVETAVEALGRLFGGQRPAAARAERAGVSLARTGQRLLWNIITDGPIRISDLASAVGLTDPVTSRQVAALEADGWIERRASSEDGRVSLIQASPAGRRAGRRLRRAADEIFRDHMGDWSAGDLETLSGLLERLVEDLRREPL